MSAAADSVAPLLERLQQQLLVSGDVHESQWVARTLRSWRRWRVEEAKRECAANRAADAARTREGTALLTVELPLRTISEKNVHEHWSKKRQMTGSHRAAVTMAMRAHANASGIKVKPPCVVRLTRLAPLELDAGDNLEVALYRVRDGVADWLGINDRSADVTWECRQERTRHYGVRVEVLVPAVVGAVSAAPAEGGVTR